MRIRASLIVPALCLGACVTVACSADRGPIAAPGAGSANAGTGSVHASTGSANGSCADIVRFNGLTYMGTSVQVAPVAGEALGEAVRVGCDEGGDDPSDVSIAVAAFPGVPSDVALVELDDPSIVLIADGLSQLPPQVEALMKPPPCDPADEPIVLSGPWNGILGADGQTEVDLVPPYDLEMDVQHASAATYERASLTIRVPVELGRPITHADVEAYLWHEGSVSVTATCLDGGYLAQSVTTGPPG